jgi:hypothetical protein
MNEHSRSIDIRHHAVRQDYIQEHVQIGGVKTTANPSDILTKFLPAHTHIQHASALNIQFKTPQEETTTTYTQNGNFITQHTHDPHEQQHIPHRTAPRPRLVERGRSGMARRRMVAHLSVHHNGVERQGMSMPIRRRFPNQRRPLHPCFFSKHTLPQTKRQRQQYWNDIHRLRRLNPQLSIIVVKTKQQDRTLQYVTQTKDAFLEFNHDRMCTTAYPQHDRNLFSHPTSTILYENSRICMAYYTVLVQ